MTECSTAERVKFKARERQQQVICNVHVGGSWDRVEHYHEPCYRPLPAHRSATRSTDASPPVALTVCAATAPEQEPLSRSRSCSPLQGAARSTSRVAGRVPGCNPG
ncbi:MAG: hypothetical protein R2695_01390 [Acidimicrobiales bacterium]